VSGLPAVSLPGTEITTSILGFGCSRLLGPKSLDEALRLLGTAYDSGIRHFDVARAYASGDAEGVLGRFIAGRRDEVTVTTKFGLQPLAAVSDHQALLAVARRLMRASPAVRSFLGRQGAKLVKRGAFSVEEASRSLEASLRELRTDYVDVLLLHDCRPEDCSPELLEFLTAAVTAGKIRAFGVGTHVESARAIARSAPDFAHVLQFENSLLFPAIDEVDPAGHHALITHGALASFDVVRRHLHSNPELCMRWSAELEVDCGQDSVLVALMLQFAVLANRRGPVLFSSTRRQNIAANALAVSEPSRRVVDRFVALLAPEIGGGPEHAHADGSSERPL
jgi:D-threo-aldose 1-dehydrogenase